MQPWYVVTGLSEVYGSASPVCYEAEGQAQEAKRWLEAVGYRVTLNEREGPMPKGENNPATLVGRLKCWRVG